MTVCITLESQVSTGVGPAIDHDHVRQGRDGLFRGLPLTPVEITKNVEHMLAAITMPIYTAFDLHIQSSSQ